MQFRVSTNDFTTAVPRCFHGIVRSIIIFYNVAYAKFARYSSGTKVDKQNNINSRHFNSFLRKQRSAALLHYLLFTVAIGYFLKMYERLDRLVSTVFIQYLIATCEKGRPQVN